MREPDVTSFDTGLRPQDVDPQRPRPLQSPWGTLALFSVAGEILCTQAFCPHLEGPLFQGTLTDATVTCPWHFWRFDLRTGRRLDAARPRFGADARRIRTYAVERSAAGTLVLHPIKPDFAAP